MRVIVTGAAGFIGSHVAERLRSRGDDVHGMDDLSSGSITNVDRVRPPFTLHQIDVTTPSAADLIRRLRPDVVVHLAAQTEVGTSMQDPLHDARSNVIGVINVAVAAAEAGCRKVVFTSSGGTIYGDPAPGQLPVNETAMREPLSFYGLSKVVGGMYLDLFRRHGRLNHTTLALGNVYGPRQSGSGEAGVVAIFAERMAAGLDCVINGDGCSTRDFVYIDDACDAIERATTRGSGLINIGTGVETTITQVHDTLARAMGVTRPAAVRPARHGEVRRIALDPARADRELGWQPQTDFPTGVEKLVRAGTPNSVFAAAGAEPGAPGRSPQ